MEVKASAAQTDTGNSVDFTTPATPPIKGIMLFLDFLLIGSLGATGAAIASSVAYLLASVYTLFAYRLCGGAGILECLVPRRSDWSYAQDIGRAIRDKLRRKPR